MKKTKLTIFIFLAIGLAFSQIIYSQTTKISYQGHLDDDGSTANGQYDFKFRLYNSGTFGSQLGNELIRTNVPVTDGVFILNNLDFGATYTNTTIWLEIDVRQGLLSSYTTLSPRQRVNSSPTSIRSLMANDADQLGGVSPNLYVRTNDPTFVRTNDARLTDSRSPTSGSPFYIQNGTREQSSSNFRISGIGQANSLIANTELGVGTNNPTNPFVTIGTGTDVGGVTGSNDVVGRIHQNSTSRNTALSIDSTSAKDAILYFSRDGAARWGIRSNEDTNELEIRYNADGQNRTGMRFDWNNPSGNGWVQTYIHRLQVEGNASFDGNVTFNFLRNGAFPMCLDDGNRASRCTSSKRFKNNIRKSAFGLDLLLQLTPVEYNRIESGKGDFGLIAEEVADIEPLLATYEEDGTVLGVKYDRIGVVAVNAIKEQQAQIKLLRNTINKQKSEIESLKKQRKEFETLKALVCLGNNTAEICK